MQLNRFEKNFKFKKKLEKVRRVENKKTKKN